MLSLIEVVLTFVGVMLVLALAAQSIQELIKASFGLKGGTTYKALERLVAEAARSHNQSKTDADDIVRAVRKRLQALGQGGVRPRAVRLDAIAPAQLGELIKLVSPDDVSSLRALDPVVARERLRAISDRAVNWFPLAMSPVDDRYRRRMRGLAVVSSAIVVLGVNADAFKLMERARRDPEFRARVAALAARADSAQRRAQTALTSPSSVVVAAVDTTARRDTSAARRDTAARQSTVPIAGAAQDSTSAALQAFADASFIGGPKDWQPKSYAWWVGILLSIALVSLGAPFWHDTLEAMFGLKSRLRAQAKLVEQTVQGRGPVLPPPVVAPETPTLSGPVPTTRPAAGGGGASSG